MNARRSFLRASGALVVSFTLTGRTLAQDLPGSLGKNPKLESWIRVGGDGSVTVFTGKAELGQGIKTALAQIAAEELDVAFERVKLVTADTGLTPEEGYTAGSNSLKDSGTALRNAAAQVRALLVAEAARRWQVPADGLAVEDAMVVAAGGRRLSYGELAGSMNLRVQAAPVSKFKDPQRYRVMNRSIPRVDIPGKVAGAPCYVHDLRLPGMLHARVVLPPSYGATLAAFDERAARALPGVVEVIRDGNFVAVVAEREWSAIEAMKALAKGCRWNQRRGLPDEGNLPAFLASLPSQDLVIDDKRSAAPGTGSVKTLAATYTRAYQMHASIGPSCAVAEMRDGALTVWSHTQGVFPDRAAIAEMLGLAQDKVRVIHLEGAGCYGHNGADDCAADAALIATRLPGRPVRVQWMREQEHTWEPFGPAMLARLRASIDSSGRIVDWNYDVWSNTHSTRPGPAGSLLAARHMAKAFAPPLPQPIRSPEGMGDRNAIPLYTFAAVRVVHHFLERMPLRVSALRALGAYLNVFAIESFMDELAQAAGADPVEFRLRHLEDARGREVVRLAADKFGWKPGLRPAPGLGHGFGFARYKNLAAYCAVAAEVEVDEELRRVRLVRAVVAVDSGQVVNPDGLRNQIEGAILQSASWTLYEAVRFDDTRITSIDWATYPILRFDAVPQSVAVHIVDRPGEPFLGSGETGQGPAAGAIGNAVANATGKRYRDLPLRSAMRFPAG